MEHKLTENEILKFKNVALQRQYFKSELEKLLYQEELLVQLVSNRVNENISGWDLNINTGTVSKPSAVKAA